MSDLPAAPADIEHAGTVTDLDGITFEVLHSHGGIKLRMGVGVLGRDVFYMDRAQLHDLMLSLLVADGAAEAWEAHEQADNAPIVTLIPVDGGEPFNVTEDYLRPASQPRPKRTASDVEELEHCPDCGSETFSVIYDPAAQGRHVECTSCGKVIGHVC